MNLRIYDDLLMDKDHYNDLLIKKNPSYNDLSAQKNTNPISNAYIYWLTYLN